MGGKLQGRALTAAQVPGHSSFSRLFFVTDCTTGVRFLIDTGAEVSVIPPIPNDRAKQQSGVILRAANDSLYIHLVLVPTPWTWDCTRSFNGYLLLQM
mgnify:CR=1 FL=1